MGKDNKLHIILLGRRNNGKSSLINRLTGQNVAIVSEIAGTTTDIVKKSFEVPDFASIIFIDTAGIDDHGSLGEKRVQKTQEAIAQADMAILVITNNQFGEEEINLINNCQEFEIPFIIIHNKRDEHTLLPETYQQLTNAYHCPVVDFSCNLDSTDSIIDALKSIWQKENSSTKSLIGDLLSPGDIVLLITPIDSEAPAGRMILPQVQMIRDILDNHCTAITLQPEEIKTFFSKTNILPRLAITDSQVFKKVAPLIPANIPLTSFSIILARHKGDFKAYLQGTPRIEDLKDGDRILMLESCSHHVSCEDIGRHKIPHWLMEYTGKQLTFDFVAGLDSITRPISDYAMVIQCGGCMITAKQLKNRLRPAIKSNIPVTNYGMTIAYLHGIFNRAMEVFK